jgi:hypothetical protein
MTEAQKTGSGSAIFDPDFQKVAADSMAPMDKLCNVGVTPDATLPGTHPNESSRNAGISLISIAIVLVTSICSI